MTSPWCRATPRGDLKSADSFVVFGFGKGRWDAGRSNLALAEWLVANNLERKPVIVQEGIQRALDELSQRHPDCLDGWTIIRLAEHDGVYVDTSGAAFQTDAILDREKLAKPVLVAHDLQMRRMIWAFEEVGIRDVVVPELPPTPFDTESVQHSATRWELVWLAREAFAARPLTLRPQSTMIVVALIALSYGIASYRVWRHYNPIPVVTILFPIGNGLLLIRRAIKPAKGMLAFPGGYVDENEGWQAAAIRELKEETGLEVNSDQLELFMVSSTRRGHLVVIYALVKLPELQNVPVPVLTAEVSEICVLMRPTVFAWEQDTEAARRYFACRPVAPPEVLDTVAYPDMFLNLDLTSE